MIPRLASSKKWVNFPKDYRDQIEQVFQENFKEQLINQTLVVEGRIYPEEILLRVGLKKPSQLAQFNFEISVDYKPDLTPSETEEEMTAEPTLNAVHQAVDAAGAMMTDFFANPEETEFPYLWKQVDLDGAAVFMQYSTTNSDLEAEANKLLGIESDDLLVEENENEDALSFAEVDGDLSDPDKVQQLRTTH